MADAITKKFADGVTLKELAETYELSYKSILAWAGFAGLIDSHKQSSTRQHYERTTAWEHPSTLIYRNEEVLNEIIARRNRGETIKKIAEFYGTASITLARRLKELGIKKPDLIETLTDEQISEAAKRWRAGEDYATLAKEYQISCLSLKTSVSKNHPLQKTFSRVDIGDAVERWLDGQPLHEIARSGGYDFDSFLRIIKPHLRNNEREKRRKHKLSHQEMASAIEMLQNGQSLKAVAKHYGIWSERLAKAVETYQPHHEEPVVLTEEGLLSAIQSMDSIALPRHELENRSKISIKYSKEMTATEVVDAALRFKNGEELRSIAESHTVTLRSLREFLIYTYWKCGVSISDIHITLARSRHEIAEILRSYNSSKKQFYN